MNKVIIQGLFIIASFFLTWFALQQVDWGEVLNIKQATHKTEEKLGEIFWETVKSGGVERCYLP